MQGNRLENQGKGIGHYRGVLPAIHRNQQLQLAEFFSGRYVSQLKENPKPERLGERGVFSVRK
jgi:hypothetical protein